MPNPVTSRGAHTPRAEALAEALKGNPQPAEEPNQRLALGDAPTSFEVRLRAKILASMFAAGATLALLSAVLPHSRGADEVGLLVIVGIAYVVAGVLLWRVGDRQARFLPVALAWGSTLITGVAYFSGQSPSPLIFFYLWVFLYSAYFFTKKQAAVQFVYLGAAYAGLLLSRPPSVGGRRGGSWGWEPCWWPPS